MALALLAFVVYNANGRVLATGDSRPARFLPFAVLGSGTLHLDAFRKAQSGFGVDPYWIVPARDGHLASAYPVVTPLLVTPLYVPAVLYVSARQSELRLERVAAIMEKLAASFVAALGVGLAYLLLRRQAPRGNALLLTLAYAFGTNVWATSSQALWQHGAAHLFLLAGLLSITGERGTPQLVVAGLAAGLLAANRPPDALLGAGLIAFLLVRERRRFLVWAGPFAATLALLAAYNLSVFGHLSGGYGASGHDSSFFSHPWLPGLAALLVSPAKGLLVFTPFLAFVLLRIGRPLAAPGEDRALTLVLAATVVAQLLLYSKTNLTGGACFGPRFLVDLMPALVFLLAPVIPRLGRFGRIAFLGALLFSVGVQGVGVFCYPRGSSDVELEKRLWSFRGAPLTREAQAGLASPEIFVALRDETLVPGESWRRVEDR